jgi:exosortase
LLAPTACLTWAFWTTLTELAQTWHDNPQYSHGYLVPGFALALLWLRRDRFDRAAMRPSLWGLPLLAGGLGLRLYGAYYYYTSLDAVALLPSVAGLVLLLGGWRAWRWAWPSVLFLAFMIPLPFRVANALSGPLQRLATVASTFVMQVLGLPALAEGNVILLNDHTIGIVEACNGLRMLVVFFALSTAFTLVVQRPWLDKVILLASAVPIALIANVTRVTTTGVLHELTDSATANAFFHDLGGWLMMPLALGLLWIELKVLSRLLTDPPATPPRLTRDPAARRPLVPRTPRAPRPVTAPAAARPRERGGRRATEPTAEKT